MIYTYVAELLTLTQSVCIHIFLQLHEANVNICQIHLHGSL